METAEVVKWLIVGFLALGSLCSVSLVGRQRKPSRPRDAILVILINALIITGIVLYWKP